MTSERDFAGMICGIFWRGVRREIGLRFLTYFIPTLSLYQNRSFDDEDEYREVVLLHYLIADSKKKKN